MGLLNSNSLNEWLTGIPERAREAYRGLLNTPSEVKQLFDPQFQQGLLKNATPVSREDIINQGLNISGMAPYGMAGHIVYHGSPHKFNKFDMSKIGTGEGAQAYGHGLYFAESPDVAKGYHRTLSKADLIKDGQRINYQDMDTLTAGVAADVEKAGGNLDAVRQSYLQFGDNPLAKQRLEKLNELGNVGAKKSGAFYKVDIPDEAVARMLDWDKPLSEQAPEVQKALQQAGLVENGQWGLKGKTPVTPKTATGSDLWTNYMQALDANGGGAKNIAPEVSKLLNNSGIPGIRYLDQGSRTAGEGTYNYVLFDDQLPRILEINGQPTGLLSWADEAKKVKKKK